MILRGLKLALVLALLTLSSALAQNAPTVTIARLAGTVEVAHRDVAAGAWQAATQGQTIGAGWKLRTGKGGKVQLTFPRNNTVVLKENSVLYVDKLDAGGGAKVKSDKGGFLFQLKNALGSGSTFEVDTPSALATVRGTEFGVNVGGFDDDAPSVYDNALPGFDGQLRGDYSDESKVFGGSEEGGDEVKDTPRTRQGGVSFEAVEIAHEGLAMQGAAGVSTIDPDNPEEQNVSITPPPGGPVPIPYPSVFEDGTFEKWTEEQDADSRSDENDMDQDGDTYVRLSDGGVIDTFTWEQLGGPMPPSKLHGYSGEVEVENEHGSDKLVAGTSIFVVGNDPPQTQPSGPDAAAFYGELEDFLVLSSEGQDFFETGDKPTQDQLRGLIDSMVNKLDDVQARITDAQGLLPGEHVGELVEILIGLSTALEELSQVEADFEPVQQAMPDDPDVQTVAARIAELHALIRTTDRQGQNAAVNVRGWDPIDKKPILGRIDRELTRIQEEWQRYDHNDQAVQKMFLWKQVLDLHDDLHELIDDVARQSAAVDPEHPMGDEIEQMVSGPFQFSTQQGTLPAGEIGPLVPDLQSLLLPAVQSLLLPAVQQVLAQMDEMNAQILALHERMEEMGYEIEPLIDNNEDLRELLRGLIDSGDPVLGLRWQNIDTDNDGLSDVAEIALGLDPLVSNDDGFIELIEPDDRETFEFPQDRSITFGFEPLDTDAIEEYTLVLEADGRRFTRRGARGFDRVELEQLVGPGGAFADSVGPDGALEVEWFVTGRIDQRAIGALDGNPSLRLGEIESEHRSFTIQFPVQSNPIILDLNEQGVAPQVGGMVRVRGSISEVSSLGEWEIRIAYDPQVLQFERGQRLGMFATATVFFGEQGGGIVVISGSAPRGTGGGLSGEGDIFELEFTALEAESTFVEGDDLILRDSFGNALEAEFGTDASIDIEEARGTNRRDPDGEFFQGGSLLRQ